MDRKYKIAIVAGAMVVSFAAGRYTVPTKVKTDEKVEKKKDETKNTDKTKHKVTTITTDTSGHKIEVITEDDTTKQTNHIVSDTTKEKTKEVSSQGGTLNVLGLVKRNASTGQLDLGAGVTKDILGPINLGIFGYQNGDLGVSLGLRL